MTPSTSFTEPQTTKVDVHMSRVSSRRTTSGGLPNNTQIHATYCQKIASKNVSYKKIYFILILVKKLHFCEAILW